LIRHWLKHLADEAPESIKVSETSLDTATVKQAQRTYSDDDEQLNDADTEFREHARALENSSAAFYMRLFVEEIGVWMDSMDVEKHFSTVIPFQSLREPMLKYALLACGSRSMNLLYFPNYPDQPALH
jgi:hypothetical protein